MRAQIEISSSLQSYPNTDLKNSVQSYNGQSTNYFTDEPAEAEQREETPLSVPRLQLRAEGRREESQGSPLPSEHSHAAGDH